MVLKIGATRLTIARIAIENKQISAEEGLKSFSYWQKEE